jgi:hypothetical protein
MKQPFTHFFAILCCLIMLEGIGATTVENRPVCRIEPRHFCPAVLFDFARTPYSNSPKEEVSTDMMGRLILRVDMSNEVVADGVYIAGNFFSSIGLQDWKPYPMCEVGPNLWEICIANVPAGRWQYKFLNGESGWEFNAGVGGTCTNPADNHNRWLQVTGGTQSEGPFCFNSCNVFCNGPISGADVTPPVITDVLPADVTINCNSPLPDPIELAAMDDCNVNFTITTGPPVTTQTTQTCGNRILTRTWTALDCSNNRTTVTQRITVRDVTPPVINTAGVPANITVQCGSAPAAAPLPASDACDAALTATGAPTDVTTGGSGPCVTRTVRRTWQARDCTGNTTSFQQIITITDNIPPSITSVFPPSITVSCGNVPAPATLTATDACDPGVTATGLPTDNTAGLNACGVGQIVRTWRVNDCAGNSRTVTQAIVVEDATPPTIVPPAPVTVNCTGIPAAAAAVVTAADNCSGTPTVTYIGETTAGTGCPYQLIRTWRATDCTGNSATSTQVITVQDNVAPIFANVPANISICVGAVPTMPALTWTDNCGTSGSVAGTDAFTPALITRTWQHTDLCGNTAVATQLISIVPTPVANAGAAQVITCANPSVAIGNAGAPTTGFAYLWTGNGINTNNNTVPSPSVTQSGQYTVTVTELASGQACSATATVSVTENKTPPVANAGANQVLNCQSTSVTLDGSASTAGAGITYQWFSPSNNPLGAATTQAVTLPGTYRLVVTNTANGCSTTSTATVTVSVTLPGVNAGSDQTLTCNVTAVNIGTAGVNGINYVWSNGTATVGNTAILPVSVPGTYILTANDPVTGCSAKDTVVVNAAAGLPVATASVGQALTCAVNSVTLDGTGSATGAGITYQWAGPGNVPLGTAITQNATQTGTYTLVVTNTVTGCSASTTTAVTADRTPPTANAGASKELTCTTTSVNIGTGATTAGLTYNWSGSAGTSAIVTVSVAGTYTLTVTNPANGCSATSTVSVTSNVTPPVANAGTDRVLTCSTTSVSLDGSGSATGTDISYQWVAANNTNVGTGITQNVTQTGTYRLIVTNNATGCTAAANVNITADRTPPMANAGVDQVLTCATTSVSIGTAMTTGLAYNWTNNGVAVGTTVTINAIAPGTYILRVTNPANGCTATDTTVVTRNGNFPAVQAAAGGSLTCAVNSVTLDGAGSATGAGITYQWAGPGNIPLGTAITQNVTQTGTYTLVVTNTVTGCSASTTTAVTADRTSPTANAGASKELTCTTTSVNIGTGATTAGLTYNWSGGAGTSAIVTVSAAGTYTLTVTNLANGCSATSTVSVTSNVTPPVANAGADRVLTCSTTSVSLDGSGSATGTDISYQWVAANNTNLGTGITQNVTQTGTYRLIVTNNATGCTAAANVNVTADRTPPMANAGADQVLTCATASVSIGTAMTTGLAYNWTNNGVAVGTTATINATAPGTYILRVTNPANGCTATDTTVVTRNGNFPAVQATAGGSLTCAVNSVTLDGTGSATGAGITYQWAGPGNLPLGTAITQNATQTGTYTLVVTNTVTGCSASTTTAVTADRTPPTANAGASKELTCTTTSVNIGTGATTAGLTYNWSGGAGTSAIVTVSAAGTYTLTVTNPANGCSATSTVSVTSNVTPPVANAGTDRVLTCSTTSVSLDGSGSAAGTDISYQWVAANNTNLGTGITQNVTQTGTYRLIVTNNATGCTAAANVNITADRTPPMANAGADRVLTCATTSVSIGTAATTGLAYNWTNNGVAVGTTATINATAPGTYILRVTNPANGCTATDTTVVTRNGNFPAVQAAAGGSLTCAVNSVTLDGTGSATGAGITYQWAGPGNLPLGTAITQNATQTGTYTLVVTNTVTGCSASTTTIVVKDTLAPVLTLSSAFEIGCSQSEVLLSLQPSGSNFTYIWTGPGGFNSTIAQPTATQSGTYNVVVRQTSNGCTSSASAVVSRADTIRSLQFAARQPSCNGPVTGGLQVNGVFGGSAPYLYALNQGAFTDKVLYNDLLPGTYQLRVQDSKGCEYDTVFTVRAPGVFSIDLPPTVEIQLGDSVQFVPIFSILPKSLQWDNAATLSCANCANPFAKPLKTTSYTISGFSEDSCSATATVVVLVKNEKRIYIPNIFYPGSGSGNDILSIFAPNQIKSIRRFQIFNRWGEMVFAKDNFLPNDIKAGWDGNFNGKNAVAGVYVYYVEAEQVDGEVLLVEGDLLLVR